MNQLTTEIFKERAQKRHGTLYSYDKVSYVHSMSHVIITCSIHGDFEQRPYKHLAGRGCPYCRNSKAEVEIGKLLKKSNRKFKQQVYFPDLKGLGNGYLKYDFAVLRRNKLLFLIEYQGEQHFRKITGLVRDFQKQLLHDKLKRDYCVKNNIELVYITYKQNISEELKNAFLKYSSTRWRKPLKEFRCL